MEGKIFGIGLSRTGTLSLTHALRNLGYKAIHFPRWNIFEQAEKYDALTDTTVCLHYKELDKRFPNSKFILTIRDINDWLKSAKCFFSKKGVRNLVNVQIRVREHLYSCRYFKKRKYKKAFLNYYRDVYDYFKGKELLVLNIFEGDGYEKLCPFLNKKILREKFPHRNKRK